MDIPDMKQTITMNYIITSFKTIYRNIGLVTILVIVLQTVNVFTQETSPKFEKHEAYQDIFSLNKRNFSRKVLKSEDAWVVLFHSGSIKRSWKSMAVSFRGIISFGMIEVNQEPEFIAELGYDAKNGHEARVYPYGSKATKQKYMIDTSNPNEAKVKATKSIPNYILDVNNMGIEDFIVDSFMSKPSRFPIIIFTESSEVHTLYKILALRLERYYNFGHMINPSTSNLQKLGIDNIYLDMPSVIVLTTETSDLENPQFNAIQYTKSIHGDITYPNVLKFLININRKLRHKLPGENMAANQEDVEMTEVIEYESEKFDISDEHHVHANIINNEDFVVDDGLGVKLSDEL